MKNKLTLLLSLSLLSTYLSFAQTSSKSFTWKTPKESESIVMNWNKSTPESEMKDDIKAMADKGVIVSYSSLKRNEKGEIVALKVQFDDKNGNKGTLEFDGKKPIHPITIYKFDDEVGFGNPDSNDNTFMFNSLGDNRIMKELDFDFEKDSLKGDSFAFRMPPRGKSFIEKKSKMIIKNDDKKPLVIEDGKIVEGGEDYSKEELDEILKNNRIEEFHFDDNQNFNFEFDEHNMGDLQEQMRRMQDQLNDMMAGNRFRGEKAPKGDKDIEDAKEEMKKAKEELQKAKKEMEDARKELEKTKSSLKKQKA